MNWHIVDVHLVFVQKIKPNWNGCFLNTSSTWSDITCWFSIEIRIKIHFKVNYSSFLNLCLFLLFKASCFTAMYMYYTFAFLRPMSMIWALLSRQNQSIYRNSAHKNAYEVWIQSKYRSQHFETISSYKYPTFFLLVCPIRLLISLIFLDIF